MRRERRGRELCSRGEGLGLVAAVIISAAWELVCPVTLCACACVCACVRVCVHVCWYIRMCTIYACVQLHKHVPKHAMNT